MLKHRLRRAAAVLTLCAVLSCSLSMPASAAFLDIPSDHWAAAEIARCVEKGFFQGQSADRFGLGKSMTRSAFAVVLCRFFGWEQSVTGANPYTDIPEGAWYAGAIDAAYTHGVLTRQDTTFRPTDPITREELTVMLVRALGYTTLAGLSTDLGHPFTDVSANAGYITLAYDMGLMNGTSTTAFSPERYATREQVAVILMRLYDRLYNGASSRIAFVTDAEQLTALSGFDAAVIPAFRLLGSGGARLTPGTVDEETASALQTAAKNAGLKTLLHVTGGASSLNGGPSGTAQLLADAVRSGGYDGLLLDLPARKTDDGLAALTKQLDAALGDSLLYLTAEAPARAGTSYGGYRYVELAQYADRLFLRVPSLVEKATPVAPVAPPENIYYALRSLDSKISGEKLGLLLDTGANLWRGGSIAETLPADEVADWRGDEDVSFHYSDRFASPYLLNSRATQAVWYLDAQGVSQRVQLLRLLGADAVCLAAPDSFGTDVPEQLR